MYLIHFGFHVGELKWKVKESVRDNVGRFEQAVELWGLYEFVVFKIKCVM